MTFLEEFEYDVFVSYGWAGAEGADEGDRGWVSVFQQKLTLEMRARLGGRFTVFFDDYNQRNGFVYKNLDEALEKSGALLFVVSPGSCRADSWRPQGAVPFPGSGATSRAPGSSMRRAPLQGGTPPR